VHAESVVPQGFASYCHTYHTYLYVKGKKRYRYRVGVWALLGMAGMHTLFFDQFLIDFRGGDRAPIPTAKTINTTSIHPISINKINNLAIVWQL
jgi:hypothetical protein